MSTTNMSSGGKILFETIVKLKTPCVMAASTNIVRPKKKGARMSAFTFEIVRQDKAPIIAHVIMLPNEGTVWRHVEALALRIQNRDGTFIRVQKFRG